MDDDLLGDLRADRYVARRVRQGRTGVRSSLAASKRDVLMFDAMVVTNLEAQLDSAVRDRPELVADIEFLAEQDFLFVGTNSPAELAERLRRDIPNGDVPDEALTPDQRIAAWLFSAIWHPSMLDEEATNAWTRPSAAIVEALSLRLVGSKAVPVFEPGVSFADLRAVTPHLALPESFLTEPRMESLVEVVLNELPIPAGDVPLADVLDFSRDESTVAKRKKLMRAVERAHIEGVSAASFQMELEEAVDEYRTHLRLHDMRSHGPTVTVLLAIPGAIEELIHGRPRKAIDQLFSLRERRVARLEKELLAPGHEYSFLYEAEKRFGT